MDPNSANFQVARGQGRVGVFTSASPRCLDGGDVDLLHHHHRPEGTLGFTATSRNAPHLANTQTEF